MFRNIIRRKIDFYLNQSLNRSLYRTGITEAEEKLLSAIPSNLPDNISALDDSILFGSFDRPAIVELPLSVKFVFYGYKQATLIHGDEFYVSQLLQYIESIGLHGILSPFEFDSYSDNSLNGYSNIITKYKQARVGSGAWRGLLISYDINILALSWLSLTYNNHKALGYYLGYPGCCVEKFDENWTKAIKSDKGDLSIRAIEVSENIKRYWGTNIFTRYFGFEFIQHFPCSLSCENSIAIGKAYEQCLEIYEPETLQQYKSFLKGAVVADKEHGVLLIPDSLFTQTTEDEYLVTYSPDKIFTSNPASPLFAAAAGTSEFIYRKSSGTVEINKNSYAGLLTEFV
jgi:hypothetical protein